MAAYRSYSEAWSAGSDEGTRERLLEGAWSDDAVFVDPETPEGLIGREPLIEYIAATHRQMPGLVVKETSPPEILANRLRVTWVAEQAGERMYTGTDLVEFAEDGRISRLTMFYDSTPD
jgi:hypothetical protein